MIKFNVENVDIRVPGNVSFGVSTERPEQSQSQVSDEQSSNWFARLSRQQSVPVNSDVREALPSMLMGRYSRIDIM